jgi:hypothetical protein
MAVAAARLSRPYLRLATNVAQTNYDGTSRNQVSDGVGSVPLVESIGTSLEKLEDALADVERTVKKVLTNSTLGLGDEGVKVRLGDEGVKVRLGDEGVKVRLGDEGVKVRLGILAGLLSTDHDGQEQLSEMTVTELFRQASISLKLIEGAITRIEDAIRSFLASAPLGNNGKASEFRRRAIEHVEMSFRELSGIVTNSKQTIALVLAHPSHGLGPTPDRSVVVADRRRLALAGGLSSQNLSLL